MKGVSRAWHNPVFQGGMAAFAQQSSRWSHGINYLAVLGLVLFITWPKEGFLNLRDLPFTYNALGGTALIILTYLSLAQGTRNILPTQDLRLVEWLAFTPIAATTFLRGYVTISMMDILFFWLLSWPLMLLACGISGESLTHLGIGMGCMLVWLGCYRLLGIALLLWLERDEFLLYIVVRLFYLAIILVSGFVAPFLNPVLSFTDTTIWPRAQGDLVISSIIVEGWQLALLSHLLLGWLFFIIALLRVRRIQRYTVSSPSTTESLHE